MIRLMTVAFLCGSLVAIAVAVASLNGTFTGIVDATATAVNAIAAVFMAAFSYQLYRLTKAIETRTSASEDKHFAQLEQQSAVMAAQQAAMEAQALAMTDLADATKQTATLHTRSLVAGHPPALVIEDVRIERNEGVPFIHFSVRNSGTSAATIRQILSTDSVVRRSTNEWHLAGGMQDHEDVNGTIIQRNRHIACAHTCTNIVADHLPPPQALDVLLRPFIVPSPNDPASPPDVTMALWIMVRYEDEAGDTGNVAVNASASPPPLLFTVHVVHPA
jgi:hypothetical protein